MIHNGSPVRFGAVLIKGDQFEKLRHANSLGAPDFIRPHSIVTHAKNNGYIAGALRSRTGDNDLFIGSNWTGGHIDFANGIPEAPRKPDFADAIIFNTRADAQPTVIGNRKPLPDYHPEHSDEVALTQALDEAGIQYERASFTDIYQKVHGVDYNKYWGIKS